MTLGLLWGSSYLALLSYLPATDTHLPSWATIKIDFVLCCAIVIVKFVDQLCIRAAQALKPQGAGQVGSAEMLKLKEEGNRLFGRKEYQKALESYDRALKVVNVEAKEDLALLHSNKAACFMMFQRCVSRCMPRPSWQLPGRPPSATDEKVTPEGGEVTPEGGMHWHRHLLCFNNIYDPMPGFAAVC